MKKFLIQIFLLLLLIGLSIYFFSPTQGKKVEVPFFPQKPSVSNIQINNTTFQAEVADTASKRSKGLGGRASLGETEGMLFIFDKADKHPFWMKGLSFPLDFVWIKDNKVIDILENIPSPKAGQVDSDLPIYSSKVEADKVLEINAGSISKFGIKVGDEIKISTQ
jgi:uncharacterized membrane protein (UPF0127 family)